MIELQTRSRLDPERRFIVVRRRGVVYDLGGELVELFTLKVLAEALSRSRDTILAWEERGHVPPPLFVVERRRRFVNDGPWRTYAAQQVVNANTLALKHFGGRRRVDDVNALRAFAADLERVWYRPEVIAPKSIDEAASSVRSRAG